eukprot:7409618-Pyramimonas_sp.AAC.1
MLTCKLAATTIRAPCAATATRCCSWARTVGDRERAAMGLTPEGIGSGEQRAGTGASLRNQTI